MLILALLLMLCICEKPVMNWPHRASASTSALMPGSDADACCGLYRYKIMCAIPGLKGTIFNNLDFFLKMKIFSSTVIR